MMVAERENLEEAARRLDAMRWGVPSETNGIALLLLSAQRKARQASLCMDSAIGRLDDSIFDLADDDV
jgi:hypothetical protein